MKRTHRLLIGSLVLLAVAGTSAASPPPLDQGEPAVAFYTDDGVSVTTIQGEPLSTFGSFQFISLDGGLLTGSRHAAQGGAEHVFGYDAVSGERLFRIKNAFSPVAIADGAKVGFRPDRFGRRDPYATSVWVRNRSGKERRIVQLTGPRATIRRDPFDGDGLALDFAFDGRGRRAAVVFGEDTYLFEYDVWVVDVRTREATRVTRGKRSRYPSLSPGGEKVALVREVDHCGGPGPGYRASDLRVMLSTGADKRTLLPGTCDLYYTDPRWISEDAFVAARLTRTAPAQYAVDLVEVDATTGEITELVATGDINYITASPSQQKVAFARRDAAGFWVYDLITGETTEFPLGYVPHLSGEHRLI